MCLRECGHWLNSVLWRLQSSVQVQVEYGGKKGCVGSDIIGQVTSYVTLNGPLLSRASLPSSGKRDFVTCLVATERIKCLGSVTWYHFLPSPWGSPFSPMAHGALQDGSGSFPVLDWVMRSTEVFLASLFFALVKRVQGCQKRKVAASSSFAVSFPRYPGTEDSGLRAPLMERQLVDGRSFQGLYTLGGGRLIPGRLWRVWIRFWIWHQSPGEEVGGWLLSHLVYPPCCTLGRNSPFF